MKDNKLNSKGMTLIEIILSIGLVSIIMVEVLTILVDLKDEQILGEDKTIDLTNRSIIVKTVNTDFVEHNIHSIVPCPLTGKVADYTLKSCLKIRFADQKTKPRFLIAARDRFNKNDYFIYGFSDTSNAAVPDPTSYEAWKLGIGRYPKDVGGTSTGDLNGAKSCGFIFKVYPDGTVANGSSRYIRIAYPVSLDEAYSNTMMNFDLEFIYYYRKESGSDLLSSSSPAGVDSEAFGVYSTLKDNNRCVSENQLTYK